MPKVYRLRSDIPVVDEFLGRLHKKNLALYYQMKCDESPLIGIRRIAVLVGYDKEIAADAVIVDILNDIWPYIEKYEA